MRWIIRGCLACRCLPGSKLCHRHAMSLWLGSPRKIPNDRSDDARQWSARAVTGSAMERTHICNRVGGWGRGAKLERRCERQMDAHLPYSAPPGDGVIPVQQLDNRAKHNKGSQWSDCQNKGNENGGRNRQLNRNETLARASGVQFGKHL